MALDRQQVIDEALRLVDDDGLDRFRLDLALPEAYFAAEYDGIDFHTSPHQRQHDAVRRAWLADHGWTVQVLGRDEVFGALGSASNLLRGAYRRLRPRALSWAPGEPGSWA